MSKPKKKIGKPRKPTTDVILNAVQEAVDQVRVKTVDFSFNELFDMYINDELVIDPAYQRLFRWEIEKRSQFIESLILELPIPPIYVVEEDDGQYELIDGLQRFSSYLHLRGQLKNSSGEIQDFLKLDGCDIVRELNGLSYNDLPTALQIRLKRMSVPVQILRKESDKRLRYHMFKRLNTGGEPLSSQEVRNAIIRLLGAEFNDLLQELAQDTHFLTCVNIMTEEDKGRMTREECVLRFFAFKNDFTRYKKLITPFLDEYMEQVSDYSIDFEYQEEAQVFRRTFAVFAETTGEKSFSAVDKDGSLKNQFSMAHYDMLTQGIQAQLSELEELPKTRKAAFTKIVLDLKRDSVFRDKTTGGGKNYKAAYQNTIRYVEEWISRWLTV